MDKEENILGKEKIGKLILKFSVPCIISLLVNSLYNMVDQIFIGWGVGYLGNGATNIVFPLVMISLAFSLMLGDGSSAYLSLRLGEKKKKEAAKGVGNGILTSAVVSILLCVVTLIFLPQLLTLFGCTDNIRPYALGYGRIIAIGLPFMMVGTSLNSVIRADGSPKYAMTSMVVGAIINTMLDPILIFVFNMGVEGAAIATIFAQFITFVINVLYIKKFKSTKLNKECFKIEGKVIKRIVMLGISSFITQMSFVFVITVQNNLFAKYGAMSKYGPDIPITVLGIVMKINQILNSIIIGVTTGAQPIFGYNYGARKFDRVKEAIKRVLSITVIVSTVAFILFQTIPDKLISIFGNGNELYMEFACLSFRTFLLLCICNGIQIPSGIFFQAIGKSSRSAILSLSRQVLFLIPAMFIFGKLYGVEGILYAGPVADAVAFVLAVSFLVYEIKHLSKNDDKSQTLIDDTSTDNQLQQHTVITISREYGSGGRYVGRLVADILGIKFYDKDFTKMLSEKTGFDEAYIESHEERRKSSDTFNSGYYGGLNNADELFIEEAELIKKISKKESCVIIGRCADFVLKDRKDVIKVFVYSSMKDKIKRATTFYEIDKSKAEKEVKRINKQRANHYKYYTEREWGNPENYDICVNSDLLGVEKSAQLICDMIKQKEKIGVKT